MNEDRMKNVLEQIARRGVPENTNLWPNISARIERKPLIMTLRTRPLMAILIALLALLVISSAVYALGRMLGYIPGIGIVEQTSSLRTLDGPAFVEREGIRLTIVNVIASPTSTSVRFQVEWLTPPPTTGDFDTSCQGTPSLVLPDGTQLGFVQTTDKFTIGEPGSNAGYGYVMEFVPISDDQSDVTFFYPCIHPIAPGPLPRDWQIPLHLNPAPEGIALPVVAVPATESIVVATPEVVPSSPVLPSVDPAHRIALSVDSFVSTDDGYLLIGSMQWSANDYPAYGVKPISFMGYVNVLDANGQDVPWQEVYENVKPQNEEYRSYWAIKVLSKTFASPLRITMNAVDVQIQTVSFRFDVGSAPQGGQSWEVNQDIQIADSLVHITKANLVSSDGNLNFQVEVQVDSDTVGDLRINTALTQCMGGGGGYPTERLSTLQILVPMCRANLPPGIVEMQVTGAVLWGQWQVNWKPS
jgi:hypothetical protein